MSTAAQSKTRRFLLERQEDLTGTSGTGIVAEGIEFSNGTVVLHWISQLMAINIYDNIKVCIELHGHDNRTSIKWIDQ